MLKFTAPRKGGGTLIAFCLSDLNLKHMREGKPILVRADDLHIPGVEILIYHATTEEEGLRQLQAHGIVIHETKGSG